MKIDLLDPSSFSGGQPHDQFRWLREHAPIFRHDEPDGPGFWALTRYAEVRAVGRDPAHFSSEPTILISDPEPGSAMAAAAGQMMLTMDPPRHTKMRNLISREFKPASARSLEPRIRELAASIVDAVIEGGECDFVEDIAGELPSYVIADLLGIPLDDGRMLYQWTEAIHAAPESLPEGARAEAAAKMMQYAQGVIDEKRARPADDLATRLLNAELDGHRLADLEFQLFFLLLVDAGGDTTRNLVAGGVLSLLERPDVYRTLRDDPTLLPLAREEMLRFQSPVIYMRRTATQDVELGDTKISAGDKVVLYYGAANRDEAVFAEPDRFDPQRTPNPHLAFGGGSHFCLGAHIARVEIDAMLSEVLHRMADLELDGEVKWLASNFISGPTKMPVRFRPA